MTDKKEDALRNKAKSNLDPKSWEALLEGVPRVDNEKSVESGGPDFPEEPSGAKKHILKVTDESGRVAEQVTYEKKPSESDSKKDDALSSLIRGEESSSAPATPASVLKNTRSTAPDKAETPLSQKPSREPLSHGSGSIQSALPPVPPADSDTTNKNKPRFSKWRAWIQKQPAAQRILHYYQGLNARDQKILLGLLLFVAVMILYTFMVSPMFEKNELANRKIEKKQGELNEMIRLRSSVVQDQSGMDQIKKVIEQRGINFSIFAYLEQLANKAEMKDKIVHIKPQRETPVGAFHESLAEIKLDMISLDEVTRFLYEIENSEDLLYVKNIRMKSGKSGKSNDGLEVTLSVGTLIQGK